MLLPVTGRLTDNQGARRMIVLVSVLLGLAYMGMARVSGALTLLGAFLAMRFLGFGSMQLVSTHVINQWFVRRGLQCDPYMDCNRCMWECLNRITNH